MLHRKLRSKKKGELPSFLLNIESVPEDLYVTPKSSKSKQHLGPLFFGTCEQFYRTLHKLEFGSVQHESHSHPTHETTDNLFLPKPDEEKRKKTVQVPYRRIKGEKLYPDPYSHKCPGARKTFVPEVKPRILDFGKTASVIEGETSMEISLCRLKRVSLESSETELEVISPSDLREETLKNLPYKKRIAHAHFPKQFATVSVIGPTIPASITITKLLTKRKTSTEMNVLLQSNVGEKTEKAKEREKKTEEVKSEAESEVDLSVEEEMEDSTEPNSLEEDIETGKETAVIEEDNDLEEVSVGGISAEPEEAMETSQELNEDETIGVDITENEMEENPTENQEEEEQEENRGEDE